jgi:hypothetical protein
MHIKSLVFISNFLLTFLTNHVLEGCLVNNKNNAFYEEQKIIRNHRFYWGIAIPL